jgi:hypothetical protein
MSRIGKTAHPAPALPIQELKATAAKLANPDFVERDAGLPHQHGFAASVQLSGRCKSHRQRVQDGAIIANQRRRHESRQRSGSTLSNAP